MSAFQQLWSNMNTGKTHLIKLDSDVKVRNDGSSNTYFTPNLSGFYGSKIRYKFGVTQPSVLPELPSYLRAKNSETVNTPRGKKDHSRREILSMENSPRSKNSSPVTIKSKLKHITNNNAYLDCEQSPNLVS